MNNFAPDIEQLEVSPVHEYSEEEFNQLKIEYERIKALIDTQAHELTLEEQRTILKWRRADRETKFILNKTKPVKAKSDNRTPKVKKPKKLTKKALGLLYIKQLNGVELTEEEINNMKHTEQLLGVN